MTFIDGGLFGSRSPIQRRNKELLKLTTSDYNFLDGLLKKKRYNITDEEKERLAEIGEQIDEILEWNSDLDDDDTHYIDINIDVDKLNKAKEHLSILELGGITKHKKEKLKKGLLEPMAHPANYDWESEYMTFYPEDYNRKLPKDGAWILIVKDVPTVVSPEKYGIYYAKPQAKDRHVYGGKYKTWTAKIVVDDTDVQIHPYEYVVIRDANLLLEEIDKSVEMITLSGTGRLDKNKVFYLKSRGFSQIEVYQILFRSLTSQSFAYFRLLPHVQEYFELIQQGYDHAQAQAIMTGRNREVPTFKFK